MLWLRQRQASACHITTDGCRDPTGLVNFAVGEGRGRGILVDWTSNLASPRHRPDPDLGLATQAAQRFFVLTQTDNLWKEHLQAIKFLQQAVSLRGYAQVWYRL